MSTAATSIAAPLSDPTALAIARKELNAAADDYALYLGTRPTFGSRPWFRKQAAIDRLLAAQAAVDAAAVGQEQER